MTGSRRTEGDAERSKQILLSTGREGRSRRRWKRCRRWGWQRRRCGLFVVGVDGEDADGRWRAFVGFLAEYGGGGKTRPNWLREASDGWATGQGVSLWGRGAVGSSEKKPTEAETPGEGKPHPVPRVVSSRRRGGSQPSGERNTGSGGFRGGRSSSEKGGRALVHLSTTEACSSGKKQSHGLHFSGVRRDEKWHLRREGGWGGDRSLEEALEEPLGGSGRNRDEPRWFGVAGKQNRGMAGRNRGCRGRSSRMARCYWGLMTRRPENVGRMGEDGPRASETSLNSGRVGVGEEDGGWFGVAGRFGTWLGGAWDGGDG